MSLIIYRNSASLFRIFSASVDSSTVTGNPDPKIYSRSARVRLTPRDEPYWRRITIGRHLGYRRGRGGGTWVARYWDRRGKHFYKALGPADDGCDADGFSVLSFDEAQARAIDWFHS